MNYRNRRQDPHDGAHGPIRSNAPQSKPRIQKLLGVAVAVAAVAVWYSTPVSDVVVAWMVGGIPVESDFDLGRKAEKVFPYRAKYDPKWTPLVEEVGHDLVRALKSNRAHVIRINEQYASIGFTEYPWDFKVVHADMVNAFCLPGGLVYVTDSLLQELSPTRGELAALLGHEMGHVLHRHAQKRMINEQVVQYMLSALMVILSKKKNMDYNKDDEIDWGEALGEVLTHSAAWLGQQY